MRARQKKKNYKKIYGCNPPGNINYSLTINSIVESMPRIISILRKYVNNAIDISNKATKNIKEMSEEEFNEKILHSELTLEQIAIAKTIREQKTINSYQKEGV